MFDQPQKLSMENKPQALLKKVFGYNEFRPLQQEIINRTLAGKDSFLKVPGYRVKVLFCHGFEGTKLKAKSFVTRETY